PQQRKFKRILGRQLSRLLDEHAAGAEEPAADADAGAAGASDEGAGGKGSKGGEGKDDSEGESGPKL
ncbi:proteasome subunit alpha, partial [Streptomyces nigrescens]